jgi:tRNA dimethylallyltransferase
MLDAGFLDEVRTLRALPELHGHPSPLNLPALRAVGYRQAWEHLGGTLSATAFRDRAIFATRQLAKRQFTWLRSDPGLQWFDPDADGARLQTAIRGFLGD